MNIRRSKKLIYDPNVNLARGKIIRSKQEEQKNLDDCKAEVDQVLLRRNVVQLPVFQIIGNSMETNIIYATPKPPPENSDIN